ncbi:quinone oxidoreductase family protein [Dyella caseinilytica]|uniref:Zinc-binding alcohol dehydrogenase family protein n=1 Tax=Dyella caseinilytica TaxID=1849581 RepID=A0ABX7H1A1_9GAMM|nr:zinc-binding alcohol dehydrogenase family protein [Dyella caseinilytica]QRN55190.1 zinc-binding alcohol dehydrogenase family protein [Dyella caseinilytica]GFZ99973.1 oxidoreductase [Dyella caseinilytica]
MKALQFTGHGGPDALDYVDVATPSIDADSALVRILAASVNPSDVKNVSGHFSHTTLPRIPGRDFSGVVEQGPKDWLGAEVWGTGGDIGFTRDGTHAQYIRIPASALARKPRTLDHGQASAIGVNFAVAWLGVIDYAQLREGETIAVIGAGGGVGGAVTQIAKSLGCRVIGIDRQPIDADSPAGKLIDAFVPFDKHTVERVRSLDQLCDGVDVVYDSVGGIAFEMALGLAKRRGRVVEISGTGRRRVELDLIDFYHNETQLLGADSAKLDVVESARLMRTIAQGFDKGKFDAPVIAHRYALAEGREAYQAVANGTAGRVVLLP